jgi:exodeoxyribonuclease VII large subunit
MHGVQRGTLTYCHHRKLDIRQYALSLRKDIASLLRNGNNSVTHLERSVANMSPENVLRRGYSITLINGRAVKSIEEVKPSDILKTVLIDGAVVSEVQSVNKTNDE